MQSNFQKTLILLYTFYSIVNLSPQKIIFLAATGNAVSLEAVTDTHMFSHKKRYLKDDHRNSTYVRHQIIDFVKSIALSFVN